MKLTLSILFCLAISVSIAKDPIHKIFGEYTSIILKANSIKVYQIEQFPVVSTEQEPKVLYIYDYEVARIYNYDNNDLVSNLSTELLDTTQFLYNDKRNCPFVGKYAVAFTKGKRTLTLLFSEKPCYKMIVFCPGTAIDKTHFDLGENNKVYSALLPLASDKK